MGGGGGDAGEKPFLHPNVRQRSKEAPITATSRTQRKRNLRSLWNSGFMDRSGRNYNNNGLFRAPRLLWARGA